MKIKKTEQILQLFDDRSAHSGSNKKTQAVHTILDTIKLCKQVYFSSFLAASIVSSKVIFRA